MPRIENRLRQQRREDRRAVSGGGGQPLVLLHWGVLPVPTTMTRLPFQGPLSWYWLECRTVPAKLFRLGISGKAGMPLTPVASTR